MGGRQSQSWYTLMVTLVAPPLGETRWMTATSLMRRITERRVDHWRTVLHDVPLSPTDIETLRGVMVSALRGATIHRAFARDAAAAARQVEMFAAMTELWLARIQRREA